MGGQVTWWMLKPIKSFNQNLTVTYEYNHDFVNTDFKECPWTCNRRSEDRVDAFVLLQNNLLHLSQAWQN